MAALARSLRPRQWVKNVLVGAAPLAAGALDEVSVIAGTAAAFLVFCLASSAIYLVNDIVDAPSDRAHPTKRSRPIAAGALSATTASAAVVILALAALSIAAGTDADLTAVVAVYFAVSLAYCFGLKHQRVIDMAIVAGGFLLRAIAGGAAVGLPLSRWFLIVAAFGSLFMVAGKRYSELVSLGDSAALSRSSLAGYSASYLRFVWGVSAAVTITAYCLWAFEVGDQPGWLAWGPLSVVPFVMAIFRFALDIDGARASAPDEIVLRDRTLLALGALWLVLFAAGAFGV
ncbi:MAG TPA: decaprenyl-phosphate phosphoribosyltransferase [Tepidiformaceae bacterium]|nr:decaprenyl-phosphate phosphoribosyltransferase [Tepidiformaceae bacterium]